MRMQKGLCIELNKNRSVFLLPDGQFVHGSPAGKADIGEEVYFHPVTPARKIRWKAVLAPAFAVLAALCLFLSVFYPSEEAFAYVQVEINPAVEIGIDDEYKVVSIRELNEDGRAVISKMGDWSSLSLEKALNRIIELSISDATEEVVITAVSETKNNKTKDAVLDIVKAVPVKVLSQDVEIAFKKANKEQWKKAVRDSIPVGQIIGDSIIIERDGEKEAGNRSSVDEKLPSPDKKPADKDSDKAETAPAGQKKEKEAKDKKKSGSAKEQKKNAPSAGEKKQIKKTPRGQEKKKVKPDEDKKTPPGQEKKNNNGKADKKTPPGPEKKRAKSSGDKKTPPGQEKKKAKSNGNKKTPPGQEKKNNNGKADKKTPPGQEKKKAKPTGNKKTPPGQEKKNNNGKADSKTSPGQEKNKGNSGHHKGNKGGKE